MQIVICPGIHPPTLTDQFVKAVPLSNPWIYPAPDSPAYSGAHILAFLLKQHGSASLQISQPLLFIGFSAGVVGAVTAAYGWQVLGGKVLGLVAVDGWGMPLRATFPIYRFSHDAFTHWSSAILDIGSPAVQLSFYAEPPVSHLNFWRAPQLAQGWAVSAQGQPSQRYSRCNAAELLRQIMGGSVNLL